MTLQPKLTQRAMHDSTTQTFQDCIQNVGCMTDFPISRFPASLLEQVTLAQVFKAVTESKDRLRIRYRHSDRRTPLLVCSSGTSVAIPRLSKIRIIPFQVLAHRPYLFLLGGAVFKFVPPRGVFLHLLHELPIVSIIPC
jgi:hypothetical protein